MVRLLSYRERIEALIPKLLETCVTSGFAKPVPKIAVVGCGYWGKNLVRNFAELGVLCSVSDADPQTARDFAKKYDVPALSLTDMLASDCDGVALATPATAHAEHVAAALEAGKHVFVEKPLALHVADGRRLATLAHQQKRTLMIGHLLQYHPLLLRLLEIFRSGRLGDIKFISSSRLNFGKLRTEEDVLWSFAPHDISMILAFVGEMPHAVSLNATAILNPEIADIADMHMRFPGGATARAFASWLHPFKEQKLVIIGSRAHAVFDDTQAWDEKLKIFDNRVVTKNGQPVAEKAEAERIIVPQAEPLSCECEHFIACIRDGTKPRTDPEEALRVLAVLDAAVQAGRTGGFVAPASPVLARSA